MHIILLAYLLEPERQVGGHDDDGVLQLAVHLGSQLRVDKLCLAQDGLERGLVLECCFLHY